jgi:hypothetical protein
MLNEFVLDSQINPIIDEHNESDNDSDNDIDNDIRLNCMLIYDTDFLGYEIPVTSYNYFMNKADGYINDHFNAVCC